MTGREKPRAWRPCTRRARSSFLPPVILREFSPGGYIVSHSESLIKSHAGHLLENLGRVLHNGSTPVTHWSRILPVYRK